MVSLEVRCIEFATTGGIAPDTKRASHTGAQGNGKGPRGVGDPCDMNGDTAEPWREKDQLGRGGAPREQREAAGTPGNMWSSDIQRAEEQAAERRAGKREMGGGAGQGRPLFGWRAHGRGPPLQGGAVCARFGARPTAWPAARGAEGPEGIMVGREGGRGRRRQGEGE